MCLLLPLSVQVGVELALQFSVEHICEAANFHSGFPLTKCWKNKSLYNRNVKYIVATVISQSHLNDLFIL
jgi:hypothetical protein